MVSRAVLATLLLSTTVLGQPLPAAKWLVDLGRDYPLSPQASPTDTDAELTLLLMQAASTVDPALAEAWLWQFDLLTALKRESEARQALERYIKYQPDDVVAKVRWLGLAIESLQTAEARAQFCRLQLEQGKPAPEVASDLHRRLAEYHWNRAERADAEKQAKAAIDCYDWNISARALYDEIRGASDNSLARTGRLLWTMRVNPGDSATARTLGHELLMAGMFADAGKWFGHAAALAELLPPGKPQPELLLEQAEALCRAGNAKQAEAVATRATASDKQQAELFARLMKQWSQPAPQSQPASPQLRKLLDAFPAEVLDYPLHPEKYVTIKLTPRKAEFGPGEPWLCDFELRNIGPFAISLGQDMMLDPQVLCAVETRGDRTRSTGPTITVSLTRRFRLQPGESILTTQTLDMGSVRAGMIGTPQASQQVEVTGVLSPLRLVTPEGQEIWAPNVGGLALPAVKFRRSVLLATEEEIRALMNQCRSADSSERLLAMERLAMLIAERQHISAGRLSYAARRVRIESLMPSILALADDPDWQIRARLAEVMRWFVLDVPATQAATRLLRDPNAVVRGLVVRALIDQHGVKFLPVLEKLVAAETDRWARRWDEVLVKRAATANRPAPANPAPTSQPNVGLPERPAPPAPLPLSLPE